MTRNDCVLDGGGGTNHWPDDDPRWALLGATT
jgi:hypothetical protein